VAEDQDRRAAGLENPVKGAEARRLGEKALRDGIGVDPEIIVAVLSDQLSLFLGLEVPQRNGLVSGHSLAFPRVIPRCRP